MTNDEIFECVLRKHYLTWYSDGEGYSATEHLTHPHLLYYKIKDYKLIILVHNTLDSSLNEVWFEFKLTSDQFQKIESKIGKMLEERRRMQKNLEEARAIEQERYRESIIRKFK